MAPRPPAHVIFDFDLTLVPTESTAEVLKIAVGRRPHAKAYLQKLAAISARSTSGRAEPMEIFTLLGAVLNIRAAHVEAYVDRMRPQLDPSIGTTIARLIADGIDVQILSSGYADWIAPLSAAWGIAAGKVTANRFLWLGTRAICMAPSPLLGSAGKGAILRHWRDQGRLSGPVVMVGDGAADYRVYREGLVDGFVSADYYTRTAQILHPGNVVRAATPGDLHAGILAVLDTACNGHRSAHGGARTMAG